MYIKNFIALTENQIKLVNHTVLAKKHKCSQSYVSRVLKMTEEPKAEKALAIHFEASKLIAVLETPAKTII